MCILQEQNNVLKTWPASKPRHGVVPSPVSERTQVLRCENFVQMWSSRHPIQLTNCIVLCSFFAELIFSGVQTNTQTTPSFLARHNEEWWLIISERINSYVAMLWVISILCIPTRTYIAMYWWMIDQLLIGWTLFWISFRCATDSRTYHWYWQIICSSINYRSSIKWLTGLLNRFLIFSWSVNVLLRPHKIGKLSIYWLSIIEHRSDVLIY